MEPNVKSQKFFIRMFAVFFERVKPASQSAKPGCMKNTSMAARSIQTVFIAVSATRSVQTAGSACEAKGTRSMAAARSAALI